MYRRDPGSPASQRTSHSARSARSVRSGYEGLNGLSSPNFGLDEEGEENWRTLSPWYSSPAFNVDAGENVDLAKNDASGEEKDIGAEPREPLVLPKGWIMYYSEEGWPYYYNELTQESTWEVPVTGSHQQSERSVSSSPFVEPMYSVDDGEYQFQSPRTESGPFFGSQENDEFLQPRSSSQDLQRNGYEQAFYQHQMDVASPAKNVYLESLEGRNSNDLQSSDRLYKYNLESNLVGTPMVELGTPMMSTPFTNIGKLRQSYSFETPTFGTPYGTQATPATGLNESPESNLHSRNFYPPANIDSPGITLDPLPPPPSTTFIPETLANFNPVKINFDPAMEVEGKHNIFDAGDGSNNGTPRGGGGSISSSNYPLAGNTDMDVLTSPSNQLPALPFGEQLIIDATHVSPNSEEPTTSGPLSEGSINSGEPAGDDSVLRSGENRSLHQSSDNSDGGDTSTQDPAAGMAETEFEPLASRAVLTSPSNCLPALPFGAQNADSPYSLRPNARADCSSDKTTSAALTANRSNPQHVAPPSLYDDTRSSPESRSSTQENSLAPTTIEREKLPDGDEASLHHYDGNGAALNVRSSNSEPAYESTNWQRDRDVTDETGYGRQSLTEIPSVGFSPLKQTSATHAPAILPVAVGDETRASTTAHDNSSLTADSDGSQDILPSTTGLTTHDYLASQVGEIISVSPRELMTTEEIQDISSPNDEPEFAQVAFACKITLSAPLQGFTVGC
jgi:hypothetical protein